jgi:hypothetical protein
MLQLLMVVCRALALALRGHRELVLENLALRQQLMAMQRANSRPRLQARDRLFWIALRRLWTNWRTAIVLVPTRDRRGLASHVAQPAMDPNAHHLERTDVPRRSGDPPIRIPPQFANRDLPLPDLPPIGFDLTSQWKMTLVTIAVQRDGCGAPSNPRIVSRSAMRHPLNPRMLPGRLVEAIRGTLSNSTGGQEKGNPIADWMDVGPKGTETGKFVVSARCGPPAVNVSQSGEVSDCHCLQERGIWLLR